MAVATNLGVSPRVTTVSGWMCHAAPAVDPYPALTMPAAGGRLDWWAALPRAVVRPCGPRSVTGSIGWLVVAGVLTFLVVLGVSWSTAGQGRGFPYRHGPRWCRSARATRCGVSPNGWSRPRRRRPWWTGSGSSTASTWTLRCTRASYCGCPAPCPTAPPPRPACSSTDIVAPTRRRPRGRRLSHAWTSSVRAVHARVHAPRHPASVSSLESGFPAVSACEM